MDDLPDDIVNKLRQLDLELEDGDITQKGYDKKKANLLASVVTQDEEYEDFGPEPSAADVDDFLDFLPSPTHSPRDSEGAALMENNHMKFQQHQLPPPPLPPQSHLSMGSPNLRNIPTYRPQPPYGSPAISSPVMRSSSRPYMPGYQPPMPTGSMTAGPMNNGPMTAGPMTAGPMTGGPMVGGSMTGGPMNNGPMNNGPMTGGRPYAYPNNRMPPQNMYRPPPTNNFRPVYNNRPMYRPVRPQYHRPPPPYKDRNENYGKLPFQ
ncbi:hypothetical protein BY458DRAFT_522932 [Sporodiniella umbellata]|nr:hypothetical protein BY458DRAFT_522932 [Sporodiniella umbellata]